MKYDRRKEHGGKLTTVNIKKDVTNTVGNIPDNNGEMEEGEL